MQVSLGEICSFTNGGTPKKSVPEYWTGDIPFITGADINEENGTITTPREYITEEAISKSSTNLISTESILLVTRTGVGKVAIPPYPVCVSQDFTALSFDPKVVHQRYLFHVLRNVKESFVRQARGATIQGITREVVSSFKFDLPTYSEQERITTILDKADEIYQQTKISILLREEFLVSLFLDMFGDPISNPKNWNVVNLGDLGKWHTGGTPSRTHPEYDCREHPWFSSGELNDIFVNKTKERITSEAIKNSAAKIIPTGSIMLGMYDTAALKSTITTMPCACNQAIAFSKLDEKIADSVFIYFLIQLGKEHFRRLQRGVRQKNMNLAMIKALKIPLPSLELQNRFVELVKTVLNLEKQIEISENNMYSLAQDLLTQ